MNTLIAKSLGTLAVIAGLSGAAHADDLVFTIKNKTNGTIARFFTSPVGVKNWEEDVFGAEVIAPGESIDITIADGRAVCKYDMRFEFTEDSGLEDLEDTQDLCAMSTYSITAK